MAFMRGHRRMSMSSSSSSSSCSRIVVIVLVVIVVVVVVVEGTLYSNDSRVSDIFVCMAFMRGHPTIRV